MHAPELGDVNQDGLIEPTIIFKWVLTNMVMEKAGNYPDSVQNYMYIA